MLRVLPSNQRTSLAPFRIRHVEPKGTRLLHKSPKKIASSCVQLSEVKKSSGLYMDAAYAIRSRDFVKSHVQNLV